ncbi:MAG: M23 family metallopeptidase [Anaeromyxobacteraceae bacterium]
MRRAILFPALVIATALGCAHATPKMTWSETDAVGSTPSPTPSPAAITSVHPERSAAESKGDLLDFDTDLPPLPPAPNPAPSAPAPLDGTLLRFAAEARARRAELPPSHAVPRAVAAAWTALAADVRRYLGRPMPETPLTELVRARVTLDAELELDRRRFGALPDPLADAVAEDLRDLARRASAAAALGQVLFAPGPPPALRWPIADAGLSSLFGPRRHPIDGVRRMHRGIDLATAAGRVVSAAAKGFVVHAGFIAGYGLAVEVRHGGDLTSRYAHLSRLLCRPGDAIDAGQPLGLVGATGRATGPHLHFEVWRGARAEDPLPLLGIGATAGSAGG